MASCEKIKISILDKEPINVNILEDKEISIKLDESAPAPTYFIDLYDTPKKYAGEGGKFVKVKTDETGMEFVDTSQIVNWDEIQGDQSFVNISGFTNDSGYLTTETDPIWTSEKEKYYTKTEIDSEGFLKTETDPVFTGWDKSTGISITESQISDFGSYQKTSEKGQANGYVGLDQGAKVPLQHLPSTLLKYMGVWNPVTNTPELISPDVTKVGQVYNVSAEGSRFGYDWKLGDWAIYNEGGIIELSKNSDDVVQVNGKTGSVELDLTDMNDVDDSQKSEGKILKVNSEGNHEYVEEQDLSPYARLDGSNQPFTGNISAPNLSGNNTGDQDLTPYWKRDGTSTATGNWDIGTYNISANSFIGNGSQLTGLSEKPFAQQGRLTLPQLAGIAYLIEEVPGWAFSGQSSTIQAVSAWLVPIYVSRDVSYRGFSYNINSITGKTATAYRLGIYDVDYSTGLPKNLVWDSSKQTFETTTGAKNVLGLNIALTEGWYYIVGTKNGNINLYGSSPAQQRPPIGGFGGPITTQTLSSKTADWTDGFPNPWVNTGFSHLNGQGYEASFFKLYRKSEA